MKSIIVTGVNNCETDVVITSRENNIPAYAEIYVHIADLYHIGIKINEHALRKIIAEIDKVNSITKYN